jgi:transcription termination factor Rho
VNEANTDTVIVADIATEEKTEAPAAPVKKINPNQLHKKSNQKLNQTKSKSKRKW